MDQDEKESIVSAYFSAAEAMIFLGENVTSVSAQKVVPFYQKFIHPASQNSDDAAGNYLTESCSKGELDETASSVTSTRLGVEVHALNVERLEAGYLTVGSKGCAKTGSLAHWEDLEKHQWMLDVLADLEAFASENELAITTDALLAARCKLIELSARAR